MDELNKIGIFLMLSAIYLRIITDVDVLQMIAMAMAISGGLLILLKGRK
jgi:hypothetical protein